MNRLRDPFPRGWRLCRAVHANLSGEGAARFGGRWNTSGWPIVCLAEHPALAVLEVRANLNLPLDLIPKDYVLLQVSLPAGEDRIDTLPADLCAAGDAWLLGGKSPVLRVPSMLVPGASNLLLNPRHGDVHHARIDAIEPFVFNPRLWRPKPLSRTQGW